MPEYRGPSPVRGFVEGWPRFRYPGELRMRFLILYGTTEGQTGKIARFLQDRDGRRGPT